MVSYWMREGKQLAYEDHGEGEAIIWIHPPGMGRKVFRQQLELSRSFRVIFPDLSGNGDSEAITHTPDASVYAEEVVALLDHLHLNSCYIAGYSCGGIIAQELTLNFPDRVKGLIMAGGFPNVDTGLLHFEFVAGMDWVKRSPETLARLLSHSHFRSEDIKEELCRHMAKSDPDAWHAYYGSCLSYDCRERLSKITKPILLIYGNKEFWINHHAKYYQACPDVTLMIIERAYHQTPATHWPVFNQMVEKFVQEKEAYEKHPARL